MLQKHVVKTTFTTAFKHSMFKGFKPRNMKTYESNELYVIETYWFSNPFEGIVYTDLDEATKICDDYNKDKTKFDVSAAKVFSLEDYYEHKYNKGNDAGSYRD